MKSLRGKFRASPLKYTVVDYINSIDFIVRSMEAGKNSFPKDEPNEKDPNKDLEKEGVHD